jgi:hypothetical protein
LPEVFEISKENFLLNIDESTREEEMLLFHKATLVTDCKLTSSCQTDQQLSNDQQLSTKAVIRTYLEIFSVEVISKR